MTVQEMHIGIDLLLQKVNSDFISSISKEEKDWFLNDETLRFVKQRINRLSNDKREGDQDTQKRYDDLKALITTRTLPVFIRDTKSVFSYLPSDYIGLKNDRSFTKNLCGAPYAVTTSNSNLYYIAYKLPTDASKYLNMVLKINGVTIFDSATYVPFVTGLTNIKQKFEYIDFIIEAMRANGFEAKYENYIDLFRRESIIITSSGAMSLDAKYGADASIITNSTTIVNVKVETITGVEEHENRLTKTEDIYKILPLSFGTTIYHSPLSTLERDKINVYHNQKFIMSSVKIDYIRKPHKINLILNQGCELDENVHVEIVDNVAKRIAGVVKSESYPNLINENSSKE